MTNKNLILSACTFVILGIGSQVTTEAADLQAYEDGAQIIASGIVSNLSDDEFVLKVKNQTIDVDYREWDLLDFTDLRDHLKNGQKVVIAGEVDDNWFTDDEIEADSIYFVSSNDYYSLDNSYPNYNLYYYDNDMDFNAHSKTTNEDVSNNKETSQSDNMNDNITMQGKVISLMDEKFTMQTNAGPVNVSIKPLSSNREESRIHFEKGDDVIVYGTLDENLLKNDTLSADTVVKMNKKYK